VVVKLRFSDTNTNQIHYKPKVCVHRGCSIILLGTKFSYLKIRFSVWVIKKWKYLSCFSTSRMLPITYILYQVYSVFYVSFNCEITENHNVWYFSQTEKKLAILISTLMEKISVIFDMVNFSRCFIACWRANI
jgi:hypothetical protein